jgi:DNA-binding NarL/FixJ family response regulator
MSDVIRVMLVDDHAVLRAGIRALLEDEPDITVVGEADTGEQALERLKQTKPDVVVMDLDMPGMGGLEATRRIATMEDGPRVLILTLHAEDDFLLPVLEAGGNGYLTKRGPDEDLFRAIRTVHRGEVFLYPAAAKLLLQKYKAGDEHSPVEQLSERERDVMTLTAEGFSSTEIGKKLYISPKTVDTYRARVMLKLGLSHRSELVRFALNTGLLRAD